MVFTPGDCNGIFFNLLQVQSQKDEHFVFRVWARHVCLEGAVPCLNVFHYLPTIATVTPNYIIRFG